MVSPSDTAVLDNAFAEPAHPHHLQPALQRVDPPRGHGAARPLTTLPEHGPHTHSSQLGSTSRSTPQSDDLAGDTDSGTLAVLWGALFVLVGAAVLVLGRRFRRRRWPIWVVGTAGLLVLLYAFFVAVSPLLPASY